LIVELIIAQKCSVVKGFRRFGKPRNRNRQFAPETGALPPALHLVVCDIVCDIVHDYGIITHFAGFVKGFWGRI
jgi:hypothetical protein